MERDPDTVRGPDVLLFEDVTRVEAIDRKWGKNPPVLAVEVLSPSDTFTKINRRVQEQLRFGTPLVWVLDPDASNVTVYGQSAGGGSRPEAGGFVRAIGASRISVPWNSARILSCFALSNSLAAFANSASACGLL